MRGFLTALLLFPLRADALTPEVPEVVLESAWKIACDYSPGVDCQTLDRPATLFEVLGGPDGVTYPGLVLLDYRLYGALEDPFHVNPEAFAVLIHEMVHAIDYTVGLDLTSAASVCASEGRAWWVYNDFLVSLGLQQRARWNWRVSYPHCTLN